MASWADKIPTFNPYVQQLPVEAMVKVGMAKQQQYEEGVQKIQTSIDNIAGLDVVSDLDKKYLQSKLDSLGNNLKTVAAGDFSNFQLVNSVSGMAKQISKDENVINAVSSTSKIRKEQKILEEAEAAGKSSVQNRAKFEDGVNQYINKTDIKQSYNSRYTQYTDIDKKLREVADKIHEVDNSIENPYKRDNAGNTLYFDAKGNVSLNPSKGVAKIDDAMLSVKVKGKPAEKILANFYSSLNENDQEQLKIDSWYHYRGATADTFKADAKRNYDDSKEILSNKIIKLNLELTTNPKLSTAEQNQIKAEINDANKSLINGSLEKSLAQEVEQIDANTDVEQYKYKLYTQKTLTGLAKDLSYQSYEQEYKANPYAQMDMEKRRLQFSYDNAARDQRNEDRKFKWGQYTWGVETAQKAQALKDKNDGSLPPVTDKALSTDIETPRLSELDSQILTIGGERTKGGGIIRPGQIDLLTNKYLDKITDASLNTNQKKATYLDYLAREYAKDPSKLVKSISNPNLAKYLETRRSLEIQLGQKQSLYDNTKAASKKAGFDKSMDDVLSEVGGVVDSKGRQLYSGKELFEFQSRVNSLSQTEGGVAKPLDYKQLAKEYKGGRYEALANAAIKSYLGTGTMSPTEKVLNDRMKSVWGSNYGALSKINAAKQKFESDFLAARMPERQIQVGTLDYKNNKVDKTSINSLIGNKLNEFQTLGQVDIQKWSNFSPETLVAVRKDPNASYTIEKKYDGSANLVITSGESVQTIPVTAKEFATVFPRLAKSNPWNDIKYEVLASAAHTTNLKGGSDSSNATNSRLSGYDAPNLANTVLAPLVRFDVEGDADNDGGSDDSYILRMYTNNNGIWKTGYIGNRFSSLATVQEQMKNVGPGTVSDFLKIHK